MLQYRCDTDVTNIVGYIFKGTHGVKHGSIKIAKKTSMIDLEDNRRGDKRYCRYELGYSFLIYAPVCRRQLSF